MNDRDKERRKEKVNRHKIREDKRRMERKKEKNKLMEDYG